MLTNYDTIPAFEGSKFFSELYSPGRDTEKGNQTEVLSSLTAPLNAITHNEKRWQFLPDQPLLNWKECFISMTRS